MTLLYYDDCFLDHDTGNHPERAVRLSRVVTHLREVGLDKKCRPGQWDPVSSQRLARIHSDDYVESIKEFALHGGGQIEADTVMSDKSFDVALHAAGAACDAVQRVAEGNDPRALCLVRPPGHHAVARRAMGFCLFNHIAVAAKMAIAELHIDRVLIVDWDVHHGNGTQDAFWEDEQVAYFSAHRWPFYPGSGSRDETGSGRGLGGTCNLPIEFGTPRDEYLKQFTRELEQFASRIKPQLVLISAGFDAHRKDPIGSLGLEVEDFSALTKLVLNIASTDADGKVVSVLEGGYDPDMLARCVEVHLEQLLG